MIDPEALNSPGGTTLIVAHPMRMDLESTIMGAAAFVIVNFPREATARVLVQIAHRGGDHSTRLREVTISHGQVKVRHLHFGETTTSRRVVDTCRRTCSGCSSHMASPDKGAVFVIYF